MFRDYIALFVIEALFALMLIIGAGEHGLFLWLYLNAFGLVVIGLFLALKWIVGNAD
jgi:hypothetical protein